jgi:hypothetical protein
MRPSIFRVPTCCEGGNAPYCPINFVLPLFLCSGWPLRDLSRRANVGHEFDELGWLVGALGTCLAMPSYVARPHVLAGEFVPGYLGDSFGFLPFVHGDPLANQFDRPFLVRLIRKEVTYTSGFPPRNRKS